MTNVLLWFILSAYNVLKLQMKSVELVFFRLNNFLLLCIKCCGCIKNITRPIFSMYIYHYTFDMQTANSTMTTVSFFIFSRRYNVQYRSSNSAMKVLRIQIYFIHWELRYASFYFPERVTKFGNRLFTRITCDLWMNSCTKIRIRVQRYTLNW